MGGFGSGDGGTEASGTTSYDQNVMYKGFHILVHLIPPGLVQPLEMTGWVSKCVGLKAIWVSLLENRV